MKASDLYKEVAEQLNIPQEVVSLYYNSYWHTIRQYIASLHFGTTSMDNLKVSINIPSLGKLIPKYNVKNNKG